ncbi:nucleotidyl transferase AbiEii/AbiGii toxin family protein [Arthrobacter sp. NPDC057009]|uniref:nucleotidyl transferase AbiEii/AbiGii toxin family protein n=1 Tax=Arthrobacter sp. NPDC057009 TaxID=3345996 RepID=UPI0036450A1D
MDDAQRVATEIALSVLAEDGFILAGGQALEEHGVIARMSEDVDLFALHRRHTLETFAACVKKMTAALESAGYTVEVTRQYQEFASLTVAKGGKTVVMDLGLDWWENQPAVVDVGPVMSLKDSVASKLLAVYSRGYARDYLDA